jgi:hypothetical protein
MTQASADTTESHETFAVKTPAREALTTVHGSCHCGAVTFEASVDLSKGVSRCNCSICAKIAQASSLMKPAQFKLLTGEADLASYAWGAKVSTRYFCKHCGVHVFGRGSLDVLGGEFVSVNYNALDDVDVMELPLTHWDGRHDNWMAGQRDTPWPRLRRE